MSVIPKEKTTAYQRWQFGSFDRQNTTASSSLTTDHNPTTEGSGEVVSNFSLPTAEDLERMHSEAQEQGHEAGFAAGRQEGYAAGMASAQVEAERIAALGHNFQDALTALDQQVADQVLELALEVARQIVRSSLAKQPESILPIIREAVAALPLHHGNVSLLLSPSDAQLLHAQLGNQITQFGWHLIEDTDITAGGCKLRAGTSEIDATLETRWRRILQAIGSEPASPDA